MRVGVGVGVGVGVLVANAQQLIHFDN